MRIISRRRAIVLLLTGFVLAGPAVMAQASPAGKIQVSDNGTNCLFALPEDEVPGETIVCGALSVPENWRTPGVRGVTIGYAILKSPSPSPFPDPVVYLEGGPGASALASAFLMYPEQLPNLACVDELLKAFAFVLPGHD